SVEKSENEQQPSDVCPACPGDEDRQIYGGEHPRGDPGSTAPCDIGEVSCGDFSDERHRVRGGDIPSGVLQVDAEVFRQIAGEPGCGSVVSELKGGGGHAPKQNGATNAMIGPDHGERVSVRPEFAAACDPTR